MILHWKSFKQICGEMILVSNVVIFFIFQQADNPIDYSDSFFKIIKEWSLLSLRKSMPWKRPFLIKINSQLYLGRV